MMMTAIGDIPLHTYYTAFITYPTGTGTFLPRHSATKIHSPTLFAVLKPWNSWLLNSRLNRSLPLKISRQFRDRSRFQTPSDAFFSSTTLFNNGPFVYLLWFRYCSCYDVTPRDGACGRAFLQCSSRRSIFMVI